MDSRWNDFLPASALGKYVNKDTLLKVLTTRSLRWSLPSTFNDPFDCQPPFKITPASDQLVEHCIRELFRVIDGSVSSLSLTNPLGRLTGMLAEGISRGQLELDDVVSEFKLGIIEMFTSRESLLTKHRDEVVLSLQDVKVLCLTKTFEETLMWSHYAASHSGALIIFGAQSSDSQFQLAQPVIYSDDPIELIEHSSLPKLLSGQTSITELDQIRRSIHQIVFTKSKSWSYENEWRIQGGSGFKAEAASEYNSFHVDDVLAVVFGSRYPKNEIDPFIKVTSQYYPNIKWFCVRRSDSSVDLVIESIL